MALLAMLHFDQAIKEAENLLSIYEAVRGGRGRRYQEVSLNRAAVVFAIAAWQTFIEEDVKSRLRRMEPDASRYGSPTDIKYLSARAEWRVVNARVLDVVQRFSSPTAENSRQVYLSVGHDPFQSWSWTVGQHSTTPAEASTRLNEWVTVRHAIAHGSNTLPEVGVLARTASGRPTLRKKNAEGCVSFVRRLAETTSKTS